MKTFLIIVLAGALATAAYATRPTERQFRDLLDDMSRGERRAVKLSLPAGFTWHDRMFWVEVRSQNQLVFVGAFSHFFARWDRVGRPDESALVRLP